MKLSFYGAAKTVTGSKHLISLTNGRKLLLDCGMFQGRGAETDAMNRHFGFDVKEIDYLILSHAHIDHSGLIPKMVKDGFQGSIYCTQATFDLCEVMLADSAGIQESDAEYLNRKRKEKKLPYIKPLYTEEDVQPALDLFRPISYDKANRIDKDIELLFTDAGHILGSACVNLTINDNRKEHRIAFTGDIGRYNNRILKNPQPFPQADYIICESTYGNKIHASGDEAVSKFLKTVIETCAVKKGKLIIPAFSVGRTQEIVNVLNNLAFEGKLPEVKVYVDSPMAVDATDIMKKHSGCFNENMLRYMSKDPTPFGFKNLRYIRHVEESIALNTNTEPCIIISASGMMEAGRVKHHLKNNIEDAQNTLLIVGWCTPSSLGGRLINGDKKVSIFGEMYDVNADVVILNPFSAHGDSAEMLQFLGCQDKKKIKQLFLVHGEEKVLPEWKENLSKEGYQNIEIPHFKSYYALY